MLLKQVTQRNNGLSGLQKVLTAAAGTIPPMNIELFHAITGKMKRGIGFDVAPLQEQGSEGFRQRLISKLIQLVPTVILKPFFLIAFR